VKTVLKNACVFFHKRYLAQAIEPTGVLRVPEHEKGSGSEEIIRASGQFMGHGMAWALSVLLFLAVGAWLDSKLGTSPVLLILGSFVGAGAGFYSLYYHIVIEPRKKADEER
jgi:F0F1-type ATP synthase assembly protein I